MGETGRWLLMAACAILGAVDIWIFFKTEKEDRSWLHMALLICGGGVMALSALQLIRLLGLMG